MQIPSARFQPSTKATAQLAQKSDSQSFGLEFDPFGGVKDTFRTGAEAAGEFLLGATPGVGIQHQAPNIVGWMSSNRPRQIAAGVGTLLNAAGSVSLAVGIGQAAIGADPSGALTVAAGALFGSGVASVYGNAVK